MAKGTVKWFNGAKGYGFITPNPEEKIKEDLFVHQSEIKVEGYRQLNDGQEVEFDVSKGQKGPQATNVRPVTPFVPGVDA